MRRDGFTVQIVNPGFVETPMTEPNKDFDMPFIMSAERAAKIICDGFERSGFEIVFPRRLAYLFKAARLLALSVADSADAASDKARATGYLRHRA